MANLVLLLLAVGVVALGVSAATYASVIVAVGARAPRRPSPGDLPPISVLKPLKGVDGRLLDNLRSIAIQAYPRFQIVLGCEDVADPALLVARRLQREYPDVDITVAAGAAYAGNNPKVANLRQLVTHARYELLVISDADVRVGPEYLETIVAELDDPRVGLVSNLVLGAGERTLGATLDSLHLNTFIAGAICGADRVGHPCVIGKSMLLRRADLERLDGWRVARDVLAEDYVVGQLFHRAGLRVALCKTPIAAVTPSRSVREFFERHVRWSQMRRRITTLYWGEPLLSPSAWFCGAFAASLCTGALAAMVVAAAGLALHIAVSAVTAASLRGRRLPACALVLIPLKDVLVLAAWFVAVFKTSVAWRGNRYRIGPGSVLTPLAPAPADPLWARNR